ncbi:MAG: DUF3800 domain-containing protein [Planctomycetes bacterium]|nr:DUF3800 domain-containing protein [Planctomycetota bacterium]
MKYIVICDESYTSGRFLVLGALVVPRHNHAMLAAELKEWKVMHGLNPASEFKWTKVSTKYLPLYTEMVEWFFGHLRANHLRFRSLVMDTGYALYRQFSQGDRETGFYKAYYHLLMQSLKQVCAEDPGESVLILLDERRDRYPFQWDRLRKTLNATMRRDFRVGRAVANIEHRVSSGPMGEVLLQVVDVLIGAIGFVRNGLAALKTSREAKRKLVQIIEKAAGTRLSYDTLPGATFNVWTFDLAIAMARKKAWEKRKEAKRRPEKRKRPQT